jgi:hypothetical protein
VSRIENVYMHAISRSIGKDSEGAPRAGWAEGEISERCVLLLDLRIVEGSHSIDSRLLGRLLT